jgi:hypothetical protein
MLDTYSQYKIDKYNIDFPLLSGGIDSTSYEQKIAWFDAQKDAELKANYDAYIIRENRRQEKQKKKDDRAQKKEKSHILHMFQKWGINWHHLVCGTEDDCYTALCIRVNEEEKEEAERCITLYNTYLLKLEEEERHKKIYEESIHLENEIQKEREIMISEKTAGFSDEEKQLWIFNMEAEEYDEISKYLVWEKVDQSYQIKSISIC